MSALCFKIPKSSRVFLLEDSELRIEWFKKKLHNLTIAKTADEAISILTCCAPFDFVFLDHDLGILDYTGENQTGKGNGQEVALHLAETGFLGNKVCIHSWNPSGAANMARILKNAATVIPFGNFDIEEV